jgi:copper homeostasis protein (lipoprotein)
MISRLRTLAVVCVLAGLPACSSTQWQSPSPAATSDTAETEDTPVPNEAVLLNSEDYVDRFVGTLPCENCDGIRTDLLLYTTPDGEPKNFELQEVYLGTVDGDRTYTSKGDWKVFRGSAADPNASVYEFESDQTGPMSFLVLGKKYELRLLDRSRAELDTPLPHSLTRVDRDAVNPAVLTPEPPGRDIDLVKNQVLIIRLPSNRSAGFRWSMADPIQKVVELQGDPDYVFDATISDAAGGEGIEIWRFKGIREGEQSLPFVYRKGESSTPSDKTITIVVKVE